MGDIRSRAGVFEHNVADRGAPEEWVLIKYTDTGSPIIVRQGADASVTVDPDSGSLLFVFGAHVVSAPADVAAQLNDALAKHIPDGKGIEVAAVVAQIQAQIDEKKVEHVDTVASFDAELQAKQQEIDAKQQEIADAQAAADEAQKKLDELNAKLEAAGADAVAVAAVADVAVAAAEAP